MTPTIKANSIENVFKAIAWVEKTGEPTYALRRRAKKCIKKGQHEWAAIFDDAAARIQAARDAARVDHVVIITPEHSALLRALGRRRKALTLNAAIKWAEGQDSVFGLTYQGDPVIRSPDGKEFTVPFDQVKIWDGFEWI